MGQSLDIRKAISSGIVFAFLFNTLGSVPSAGAQQGFVLPAPGQMVSLSKSFNPVAMRGLKVDPANPFRFDFLVDEGDTHLSTADFKDEVLKVIKYFLTSLTISDDDLWVNLSPYEKNRIIPPTFGRTEMGRDLLAQDYILKQITASLIYPEKKIGKEFWDKVYSLARKKYGTNDIPINTFNKVWIVPDHATVYVHKATAFVLNYHLKVMLEQDYLSLEKHNVILSRAKDFKDSPGPYSVAHQNDIGSQFLREIVIPELEKEVNRGKNFSPLRQIFYSLILATWYKTRLKQAILNQVYSNKDKVAGVLVDDPKAKEKIYQRYLRAFKKGVFNYIKDDVTSNGQTVPRKYFSGGVTGKINSAMIAYIEQLPSHAVMPIRLDDIEGNMTMMQGDRAMRSGTTDLATKAEEENRLLRELIGDYFSRVFPEGLNLQGSSDFDQNLFLAIALKKVLDQESEVSALIKALNDPVYVEMEILEFLLRVKSILPHYTARERIEDGIPQAHDKTKILCDLLRDFEQAHIPSGLQREFLHYIQERPLMRELSTWKREFEFRSTSPIEVMKGILHKMAHQQIEPQRSRMLQAVNKGQFTKSVLILAVEGKSTDGLPVSGSGVAYVVHKINEEWSMVMSFAHAPIQEANYSKDARFNFYLSSDKSTPIGQGYPILTNKDYQPGDYRDDFTIYLVKSRQPLEALPILSPQGQTMASYIGVVNKHFETGSLDLKGEDHSILLGRVLEVMPGDSGAPLVVEYEPGKYGVIGHLSGTRGYGSVANVYRPSIVKNLIDTLNEKKDTRTYVLLEPGYSIFKGDLNGLQWLPGVFSAATDQEMVGRGQEKQNAAMSVDHLAKDRAMSNGGIDLRSKRYQITVEEDGQDFKMNLSPWGLRNLKFDGLEFRINRIEHILNPQAFLQA